MIMTSEKSDILEQRLAILLREITLAVYRNVSRGLFERHKLVFSLLLNMAIVLSNGEVTQEQWDFLLRGAAGSKVVSIWILSCDKRFLVCMGSVLSWLCNDGHSWTYVSLKTFVANSLCFILLKLLIINKQTIHQNQALYISHISATITFTYPFHASDITPATQAHCFPYPQADCSQVPPKKPPLEAMTDGMWLAVHHLDESEPRFAGLAHDCLRKIKVTVGAFSVVTIH